MDKLNTVINYMRECPEIDRLYINFAEVENNAIAFVPMSTERFVEEYIDGGKLKYFDYTINYFKNYSSIPLPKEADLNYIDSNIENLINVGKIITWVAAQNKARNFPALGEYVEAIYCLSEQPTIAGYASEGAQPIMKHSIVIRIEYIEYEE